MKQRTTDPAGLVTDTPRRRGFFLTAWLTLLSLGTAVSAYYAVTETPKIVEAFPEAPAAVLWTKTALAILNLVLMGGVWMWNRLALYALGVSTISVFVINAVANQEWIYFAIGLVPYTVLFLTIRFGQSWAYFTPEPDVYEE